MYRGGFWLCTAVAGVLFLARQTSEQQQNTGTVAGGPSYFKKFEYKYSFKPPYLAQKDGSVPFFQYGGNAIASQDNVRLAPSLRSQKGQIWSKQMTTFDWWEVEIKFRVTGRGRLGADGLAFWYTTAKDMTGPVFGSADKWNGLGIFFDSFDNDNKHNNPYIMGMLNDGNVFYDHQNDGLSQQLGGCLRDFRNKPHPMGAKIEYLNNVLTVAIHNGMTQKETYELCFRVENVNLPKFGYFGVTAATGGLADDHDVIKLLVHSLQPVVTGNAQLENLEHINKMETEYSDYQKKLKDLKEQWKKEHPNEVLKEDEDDDWLTEGEKDLINVLEGQATIKAGVAELTEMLRSVSFKQDETLIAIQSRGVDVPRSGGQATGQKIPSMGEGVRKEEVLAIQANQKEIIAATGDIKNYMLDVAGKVGMILNKGSAQPVQPAGAGYDVHAVVRELKDSFSHFRQEMLAINKRGAYTADGQAGSSCVSTTLFLSLMVVQMIVMVAYFIYRDNRESKLKKFY